MVVADIVLVEAEEESSGRESVCVVAAVLVVFVIAEEDGDVFAEAVGVLLSAGVAVMLVEGDRDRPRTETLLSLSLPPRGEEGELRELSGRTVAFDDIRGIRLLNAPV